jgi:hypothetical protein
VPEDDAPSPARTGSSLRLTNAVVLVAVGAVTLGLHVLAVALGLRVHGTALRPSALATDWQLLPASLLRHQLLASLAHLHSQPPLFNLATGVLLNLPSVMQPYAASGALVLCAVAVAVATAGAMLELGVHRVVVLVVVTVFVIADPAQYLYGAVYFYALPTAALVTAAGWAAVRWARTARPGPGVAYGVLAAALVLTNSSYQAYVVALATVPIIYVLRARWRQVLAVLLGPVVVVAAWYANDVVQFHTATTSSWIGMNLARSTLSLDDRADLRQLVKEGVLTKTALVVPFSALQAYGPLGRHPRTGHEALDLRWNLNTPNFNNAAYLAISKQYLHDDLAWIEHRPGAYARHVTVGLRLWALPAEQYFATDELADYHLGGYTTVYDAVVNLQPTPDPTAVVAVILSHRGPGLSSLSLTVLVESALALVALPFLAWTRRRRDPRAAAGALFVWVLCAAVFVTTTLLEAAENNRFRFELGGLPLVAATLAVVWLVERLRLGGRGLHRAGGERDRGAGQALAVDDEAPRVPAGGLQG